MAARLFNVKEPEDESGLLLYEPFYGLGEKPFSLSTDPRFLYKSASHTPVFHDVLAGIRRREGLVVLTGEIGMGKTTLCRSVLGALDRKTFSAFVPDPFVSREDLLKILLVEFGVVSADDLVRGRLQGASRVELSYPLYDFLRSLEPLDAFAVLLIDEAQNLPESLLDEVRILSDLEGTRKLLQVVLIGQPELSAALRLPHMRQVKQRVTTHCELQPLDRDGVYGYVAHRLTVAGASADRLHFTVDALDLIFGATGGVPRVINRLCDRTLQRGHAARATSIGTDMVWLAMADLQLALCTVADAAVPVAAEAPVATPVEAAPVTAPPPTPAATSLDDLHALLSLPPTAPLAAGAMAAPPVVDRPSVAAPRMGTARTRLHRREGATGRSRAAVATAALLVLGALSGLTLAVYWMWAVPMLTQHVTLPPVKRPSIRIAAPLPTVLEPNIDNVGDPLDLPHPHEAGKNPNVLPPTPVAATQASVSPSVWVVQVGAFSDDARATSLSSELAGRGFTAFKSVRTMKSGALLQVVLVGPYDARAEAAAARDEIQELPGVGEPILQLVPPAAALR